MASETQTLLSLNDNDLTTASPAEDIRHREVRDVGGEKIGTVKDLMIDESEKKVRLLEIAHGGFLGLGESRILIPVDAITRIDNDVVHVNQTREHIGSAPNYDPELVVENEYYNRLYDHYGMVPFWGQAYAYPFYPLYPGLR